MSSGQDIETAGSPDCSIDPRVLDPWMGMNVLISLRKGLLAHRLLSGSVRGFDSAHHCSLIKEFLMQTATPIRSRWTRALATAALLASFGVASASAQTAGAAQGQTGAPSKAKCEQEAAAQGLSGEQAKNFIDQCLHQG